MFKSFLNTLHRLTTPAKTTEPTPHTPNQLLEWAQGCMLEGLPDQFFEAYIECIQYQAGDSTRGVRVSHKYKLTAESEYETFQPADDLYPTQCIEQVLAEQKWLKARLTFSPEKATFVWE